MPAPRHRNIRHRDRGLRRISYATRAFAAGSVALVGAFTAIAAHAQTGSKSTVRIRTVGGSAPNATNPGTAAPSTTPGSLPPDTFPPTGDTTPPSPDTSPQTSPQTAPYVAPVPQPTPQPPQIVSGSS